MADDSRLLDSTWTRVEQFDPTGPSSRSRPAPAPDAMQLDESHNDEADEGLSSEWEYEDTEELVTLDLGPESKRLLQMSHQYSITGLETKSQVFLRLGNVMFKGRWDQLIGTEILLRDQKDASKPAPYQHELLPLPATETDIRTRRAPSTTRHRIQFLPATNMMAREEALREQGGGVPGQPVITHKGGWFWVRGRGWLRKEQLNALGALDQDDADEDDTGRARRKTQPGKKKLGRKKMTAEEKMRYSIWRSLQKIDKNKDGGENEGQLDDDDDDNDEDDEEGEGEAASGSEDDEAEVGSVLQENGVS